jgi:phosphatidylinositol alpha-1,6-mannosyltransferase
VPPRAPAVAPRYFLAAYSADATNSGIGRVARLLARVLSDGARDGTCRADAIALTGSEGVARHLAWRSAGGSRVRFLASVTAAAWTHDAFLYDGPGMARAHGWLPIPRRPFLTWIHGIESWPGTANAKQVAAAKGADELVAITDFSRSRATDYEPTAARASVCWLATETDDPPVTPRRTEGPPRVTILSRVDENSYKGHAELLQAWPRVRAAVPDAILTVAGSGPGLDEQKRLAASLGLTDREIEFRGFVPEDRVDDLWAETTVFAMPSRGEGFGLVYIEAMRWGIPVIASVHDAGHEVNAHGESGYNVNLDDPNDLADRLIELLRDRDRAASLGAGGFARWQKHFRFSAFRDRFVPIVERLLTR